MTDTYTFYTTNDVAIECEYDYSPPERGSWEGGMQMEPDYPAYVELCTACIHNQDVLDLLNDETIKAIEDRILEEIDNPEYDE